MLKLKCSIQNIYFKDRYNLLQLKLQHRLSKEYTCLSSSQVTSTCISLSPSNCPARALSQAKDLSQIDTHQHQQLSHILRLHKIIQEKKDRSTDQAHMLEAKPTIHQYVLKHQNLSPRPDPDTFSPLSTFNIDLENLLALEIPFELL